MVFVARTRTASAAFLSVALLVCLDSPAPASAQEHPIWGALEPGAHAVGFSVEYQRDRSRLELPALSDGSAEPDPVERIVQVGVWYPARTNTGSAIRLGDYIELQEYGLLEAERRHEGVITDQQRADLVETWATYGIMTGVDRRAWERLLDTPMRARRDALPVGGPFPLLLMVQGASGSVADLMGTAEYLASHGYVVVTAPSRGPDQSITRSWGDARLTESILDDAEHALGAAAGLPQVDVRRIGVLGMSRGGLVALLLAMKNPAIDAVVGFDPSLESLATASPWFDASRLRVPFLLFQAANRRPPAVLGQLPYAEIQVAGMPALHHVDFSALGMIHTALGVRNRFVTAPDERIRSGLRWVNEQTLAFLDAHVKDDATASARLGAGLEAAPDSTRLTRYSVRASPPASAYLAELAWRRGGISRAGELIRAARASDPEWRPFAEQFLNASAYRMVELGRTAEALEMARLNVELFAESSVAQQTLARMLLTVGDRAAAIAAAERAVALDPESQSAAAQLRELREAADSPR